MFCAVRLDVIRGYSITYCYSFRCSAKTAKINLMVFAHVVYCVVELKSRTRCLKLCGLPQDTGALFSCSLTKLSLLYNITYLLKTLNTNLTHHIN